MGLIKRFYQSNRHVKLAIILAPMLAIGGYILTGIYLDDRIDAQPTMDKPLALQPDCHLLSGVCELLHREIAVNVAMENEGGQRLFYLSTSTPIKGTLVAFTDQQAPRPMHRRGGDNRKWVLEIREPIHEGQRVKLVISGNKHRYFAEIPVSD
ncbi:hypothetical protein [Thiolapillus brandeum]|uniref:Uncharacterized protein n=1 Tax=Thiolapillus brandeum TaxID=1076588 RepID=A0A7U6GHZ6_9GAMM|nr:hypothetical protein [Thiolapillus brandeum]BAO43991.1 hypothetical protein TBH_C1062 [Thiolapillus brandeum]